ncbi:unnamed protein product, partial [Meganyctiphanes norvegica]
LYDDTAVDHLGQSNSHNDNFSESYSPSGLNSIGKLIAEKTIILTNDENGQILNTQGNIEGQNDITGLTESSAESNVNLGHREMAVTPDAILTSRNAKNLELIRPKQ